MSRITIDPQADVVEERFAVVYAPRRKRDRFPADCVQVMADQATAEAAAAPQDNRYAARVLGPSRSSEGYRLYYLVEWLGE
ncbi:MAG: hypothetical protein PVF52_04855 [Granulosicoccaceae bacterium]|jgi:hypothetical protein